MSRLPLDMERIVRIAEEGLFLVGEDKAFLSEVGQLEVLICGLEQADELDESMAVQAAEVAETSARAARAYLNEIRGRNEQRRKIRAGIQRRFERQRTDLEHVERQIAQNAELLGVKHMRPELVAAGAGQ